MASRSSVLETVVERPLELLEDLDLRDRADEASKQLGKHTKDLRKRSKEAAKRGRELTAEAGEFAGELRDRAEDLRERVGDPRERAVEVRDRAEHLQEDLEPFLRKLAIDVLTLVRGLLGVLIAVPRLIVRALGALGDLADRAEVAREKGHELSERARDAAHSLPLSRKMRWQRRFRLSLVVAVAFGIGFVIGWFVAQRQLDELVEDAPVGLQPVAEPLRGVPGEGDGEPTPGSGTGA